MALIRCPKHNIPYNEDNPRGCPACARESDGSGNVMQELARVSKSQNRPSTPAAPPPTPVRRSDPKRQQTLNELFAGTAATIREEPRTIETTGTRVRDLFDRIGERKILKLGIPLAIAMAGFLWFNMRATFVAQPNPTPMASPLPFPVDPGAPIQVLFSVLGTSDPEPHPTDRRLARFQYGTDLTVDGLNDVVYDIVFSVSNRSWKGIAVGMTETNVQGAMALLGPPVELPPRANPSPTVRGEYSVYASLDDRPLRQLKTEVRPPNGCYDLVVDLRYRSLGVLQDGDDRLVVVARGSEQPEWVSTRVTVTNRSVRGPNNEPAACQTG